MKAKAKRVVAAFYVPVSASATSAGQDIQSSVPHEVSEASAVLAPVLASFGPFAIDDAVAVSGEVASLEIVDISDGQDVLFDHDAFFAWMQRVRDRCAKVVAKVGGDSSAIVAEAKVFAEEEAADEQAVIQSFAAVAAHPMAVINGRDGEPLVLGVVGARKPKRRDELRVAVARVWWTNRIRLPSGIYDLSLDETRDVKVGDKIRILEVEQPARASVLIADSIELADDLFDDRVLTKADRNPDDG